MPKHVERNPLTNIERKKIIPGQAMVDLVGAGIEGGRLLVDTTLITTVSVKIQDYMLWAFDPTWQEWRRIKAVMDPKAVAEHGLAPYSDGRHPIIVTDDDLRRYGLK